MTTGHWAIDGRKTVSTDSGAVQIGHWATKDWWGVDTPKGQPLVDNPYNLMAYSDTDDVIWAKRRIDPVYWSSSMRASGFAPGVPSVSWTSEDDYKLLGKLQERIQGGDFNFSVFLGEGAQTLNLIGDTALKLGSALRQVKKGNVAGAARTLTGAEPKRKARPFNAVSDNWLSLQYGWMPLLGDAKSAAETVAHRLSVPMKRSYRVTRQVEASVPWSTSPGQVSYGWVNNSRQIRKQVIYRVAEDWGGLTIPQLVGLVDPELVAWELVPFSFVCDWFLPIGNWLQARAFSQKLKGTFCTTVVDRWHWQGLRNGDYNPYSWVFGGNYRHIRHLYTNMTRSVTTTYPVRPPVFKSLARAASWQHAANAVALLVGMKTHLEL